MLWSHTKTLLFSPGIENPRPHRISYPSQKTSNEKRMYKYSSGSKAERMLPSSFSLGNLQNMLLAVKNPKIPTH
jgi:hypothetical protein